jgi:heat shock protein HslJ
MNRAGACAYVSYAPKVLGTHRGVKMRLIGLGLLLVVASSLVVILKGSTTLGQAAHTADLFSGSATFEDVALSGRRWQLTEVGGVPIKTTKPYILLNAQTKRFEGDGGCNRISGAFEVNRTTVKFSRVISTKRACADRQLQLVETRLVENLGRASSYYIRGDEMRLYAAGVAVLAFTTKPTDVPAKPARRILQANSLCEKGEQIVFSCRVKRPAKIVSLCASPDLEREQGYLQYRFGLPARIELEFPESLQATQSQFQYMHYFRYQVDLTEINFSIEGNRYQIFDAYNGEEKPRVIQYGVMIVPPRRESVSYHCRTRPKADYSKLADALREH